MSLLDSAMVVASQVLKTMELLSKYCLNDRPVPFQILSDQSNLVAK